MYIPTSICAHETLQCSLRWDIMKHICSLKPRTLNIINSGLMNRNVGSTYGYSPSIQVKMASRMYSAILFLFRIFTAASESKVVKGRYLIIINSNEGSERYCWLSSLNIWFHFLVLVFFRVVWEAKWSLFFCVCTHQGFVVKSLTAIHDLWQHQKTYTNTNTNINNLDKKSILIHVSNLYLSVGAIFDHHLRIQKG